MLVDSVDLTERCKEYVKSNPIRRRGKKKILQQEGSTRMTFLQVASYSSCHVFPLTSLNPRDCFRLFDLSNTSGDAERRRINETRSTTAESFKPDIVSRGGERNKKCQHTFPRSLCHVQCDSPALEFVTNHSVTNGHNRP